MARVALHIFQGALLSSPSRYTKAKRGGNKELISSCEKNRYSNDYLLSKEYIVRKHKTTKINKVMAKSLNAFDSAISGYMSANSVRFSFGLGLGALRAALVSEDSDIMSAQQITDAVRGFALWCSYRPASYVRERRGGVLGWYVRERGARVYLTRTTSESDAVVTRVSVAGGKTFLAALSCEYTQQRISSLWSSFLNCAKQDTKCYPWASGFCEKRKNEKRADKQRDAVASASEDSLLAALAAKRGVSVDELKALLG